MATQVLSDDLAKACGSEPGFVCRQVYEATGNEGLAGVVDFLVTAPLRILLVVVLALFLNRMARRAIRRFTNRLVVSASSTSRLKTMLDPDGGQPDLRAAGRAATLGDVLRSLSTTVIYSIALLTVLGELGLNLGPLAASAGIAGVALGFGAQSLVKDFLSGVFMLVEDQYGVGDVIDLGTVAGTVEGVGLRTTRIRDASGVVWYMPNGQVNRVGNKSQEWSRALVDVEIGHGTDLRAAQATIRRAADETCAEDRFAGQVLEPPEVLGVEQLGKDSVSLRLVVKTQPGAQFALTRELRLRVHEALRRDVLAAAAAAGEAVPPAAPAPEPPEG